MDITKDIRTLDELKSNAPKVIRDLRSHRRPVVITKDGEPDMVIIPAQMLTKKLTALKAACDLATV